MQCKSPCEKGSEVALPIESKSPSSPSTAIYKFNCVAPGPWRHVRLGECRARYPAENRVGMQTRGGAGAEQSRAGVVWWGASVKQQSHFPCSFNLLISGGIGFNVLEFQLLFFTGA